MATPLVNSTALIPDDNRGPAVIAILWVETVVTIIVIALRLYARQMLKTVGADDWMMLGTCVLNVVVTCICTSTAVLGGFRHLVHIPQQTVQQVFINIFASQNLTVWSYGLGKAAIGAFILRILPHADASKKSRYFIWLVIIVTLLYNGIEGVLTWFQCTPSKSLWFAAPPTSCWSPHTKLVNIYVGGVYNVVTDIILALFPLTFLWKLKMPATRKVRLVILLGLGLLAGVCGAVKLKYVNSLNNMSDVTWETYNLDIWSSSEVFIIIVCGSVPTLQPLWDRYVSKKSGRSQAKYSGRSGINSYTMMKGSGNASSVDRSKGMDPESRAILVETGVEVTHSRL